MPSSSPFAAKAVRLVLTGLGATAIVSAAVNIFAAYQLIEPSEELSLGLTRNQIVISYATIALAGAALMYFGLRRRK